MTNIMHSLDQQIHKVVKYSETDKLQHNTSAFAGLTRPNVNLQKLFYKSNFQNHFLHLLQKRNYRNVLLRIAGTNTLPDDGSHQSLFKVSTKLNCIQRERTINFAFSMLISIKCGIRPEFNVCIQQMQTLVWGLIAINSNHSVIK